MSYESDINEVRNISIDIASKSKYLAVKEQPKFWVMEMGKEGIKCWVCAWTKSPTDSWYLKIDVRQRLIEAFQTHGIQTHAYRLQKTANSEKGN